MNKFHFIVPAFNCRKEIESTLWSIVGQTYKNWTATIIDDLSTDGTGEFCEDFFRKIGMSNKARVIYRTEKFGETKNTVDVCSTLDEDEIVVRLDAGDWITDLGCLQILDSVYASHDPAVLWTAHRWAWTNQNISGPIDPNISVYDQPWRSSHLKTFRVRDFKGLGIKNFLDEEGNYIVIACDQAVFLPMMERARRKGRPLVFLPMVMYHYSIDLHKPDLFTCDRSLRQKQSAEWIRSRGFIDENTI
jgi:glycosyltransferase involved in cell wall biosynthesis